MSVLKIEYPLATPSCSTLDNNSLLENEKKQRLPAIEKGNTNRMFLTSNRNLQTQLYFYRATYNLVKGLG